MRQAKFSIEESQLSFLNHFKKYGFKDKSSMVRKALERLKEELEFRSLKKSAELYAEVYEEDNELKELTETAISDWPK